MPTTNNHAERHLRLLKTQLKISGCHTSTTGAQNWLATRSDVITVIEYGLGALDALRRAVTGDTWMPPIVLVA